MTLALNLPAPGRVTERTEAADLVGLALDPAERGVLRQICDLAQQDRVAGEAEDVADPVALQPGHRLGRA